MANTTAAEILLMPVEGLQMYENNPRINDRAVEPVAESIRQFGFKVPILIDKDNVIIAGHTRLKAAKLLGMGAVPCIRCDDLTPEQVKAFRLVDNKGAEFADWDLGMLNEELKEIDLPELDLEKVGFFELPDFDIDDYLKDKQDKPHDEEDEPERVQCPHCGEWFDLP